jgi:hypothetical protein
MPFSPAKSLDSWRDRDQVTFSFVIVIIICEIVKMSYYLIFSGQISFRILMSEN